MCNFEMDRMYERSGFGDAMSRQTLVVHPKQTRSSSLAPNLAKYNSTAYLPASSLDRHSYLSNTHDYSPSLYQSWTSKTTGGGVAYQSPSNLHSNSSYLGCNYEPKKQPEFKTYRQINSSYTLPSYHQQAGSLYPVSKPPLASQLSSNHVSNFDNYISSRPYFNTNQYESSLDYGRRQSISKPPIEPSYLRESLASKYSYQPASYSSSSRYDDGLLKSYSRSSRPSYSRSQSYQVDQSTVRPPSHSYESKRESSSRPYSSQQTVPSSLNFDYRTTDSTFSSHNKPYQPHANLSLYDDSQDSTVVATSNVVSSRTSAQRDLGDNYRPPSISIRRSTTPMHFQEGIQQLREYTNLSAPERSRSVVVGGASKHTSLVSRPRASMVVPPSNRALSALSSHRHSSVLPTCKSFAASGGRSSVLGMSSSMFEVETPKRTSRVETRLENRSHGSQKENVQEDYRRMSSRDSIPRFRNMLDRYMLPSNDSAAADRTSRVEKRTSRTESRRSSCRNDAEGHSPPRVRSYTGSIYRVHIPDSFTPTISDTRKKAREVLCKVRKDPNYFSFK